MDIKDNWKREDISPCCNWFSNPTKSTSGGGHRCCKCSKEW